jgi:dihydroorotase (multifunctional complex type)
MELLIRGGRCVLPERICEADLAIDGGQIVAIGSSEGLAADEVLDASGLLVLPGAIDAHVHVREPGQTQKEDYAHAGRAAAVGGVTTIISQPNTNPAVTTAERFEAVVKAARACLVDHAICAGVLGRRTEHGYVAELAAAGAVGFEVLDDTAEMCGNEWLRLFEAVAETGLPLSFLAAERSVMRRNLARARANPGASWRNFSAVVSGEAEAIGYQHAVGLARLCGTPLIIRQVTTAAGLAELRRLKQQPASSPLWVEVNVHHLFLSDDDLERLGPYAQMVPPPRPQSDVDALWEGLHDGTVDFISTDHAPHTADEKEAGRADLWTAPTGIPGLDTFLPLLLDAALRGRLSLERLAVLIAEAPARMHRLGSAKGTISVGSDADLVLVDPRVEWTVEPSRLFTKCGWSAFEGRELSGRPVLTLLRGQVVARGGQAVECSSGRLVRPAQAPDQSAGLRGGGL